VETGVTSLVPTVIVSVLPFRAISARSPLVQTQEASLYPRILPLLKPRTFAKGANLLGWHCEGPFLQPAKRGAHECSLILPAPEGVQSFENVYGADALADSEDWFPDETIAGVRIITAAPEVPGVLPAVKELTARGVVLSIGHSIASSAIAGAAVASGARLITHLFNAMPQLHHRDPAIIGLLGGSPSLANGFITDALLATEVPMSPISDSGSGNVPPIAGEALVEQRTPPQSPIKRTSSGGSKRKPTVLLPAKAGEVLSRPFYELIVDGVHSHPNSVRLAYSAFPEGCILITDAMKILDPHLADGVHEWRDGQKFVKDGDRLFLEGTDTLAGSVVTLDKCVRNFTAFTGATLGDSIRCATYNPARCLGLEKRKGTLRAGADADLVVFDKEGNVLQTWVAGALAWANDGVVA
jgi:N-acetylglucosamine-6-phosphate deacetylase